MADPSTKVPPRLKMRGPACSSDAAIDRSGKADATAIRCRRNDGSFEPTSDGTSLTCRAKR
jgi:hypothetical protein